MATCPPRGGGAQARGYALCNQAYLARIAGGLDEARAPVEEAVGLFMDLGDREGEALAVNHLGCQHRVRADYAAGRIALEQSLRLRHEIGDRRAFGLTLSRLGVLAAAEGDPDRGLALLGQPLDGFRETEDAPAASARAPRWRVCASRAATITPPTGCSPARCRSRGTSRVITAQPRGDT